MMLDLNAGELKWKVPGNETEAKMTGIPKDKAEGWVCHLSLALYPVYCDLNVMRMPLYRFPIVTCIMPMQTRRLKRFQLRGTESNHPVSSLSDKVSWLVASSSSFHLQHLVLFVTCDCLILLSKALAKHSINRILISIYQFSTDIVIHHHHAIPSLYFYVPPFRHLLPSSFRTAVS